VSFDAWYDALTPSADVILYNGHAGLGANVRTLMSKGAFVPGHYLIWFANGCDTFAYVDRTLVGRRALLNPDDPGGSKYMDTLANVMAGHFRSLEPTSLTLLHALIDVRDASHPPKTYEEIFQTIDPSQIVVVTGEEDNVLSALPPPPNPRGDTGGPSAGGGGATGGTGVAAPLVGGASEARTDAPIGTGPRSRHASNGCSLGVGTRPRCAGSGLGAHVLALTTLALGHRRRRRLRPGHAPH
jgi:hypothetical protein